MAPDDPDVVVVDDSRLLAAADAMDRTGSPQGTAAANLLRGSAQEAGASYLLNLRDLRVVGKDVPDQVRAAVRADG